MILAFVPPDAMRRILGSFRAVTGLGYDAVSPRAFGMGSVRRP